MAKFKFWEHVPTFIDIGDGDITRLEFDTLDELLALSKLQFAQKPEMDGKIFHRLSIGSNYVPEKRIHILMEERDQGRWWWVVGFIQEIGNSSITELGFPEHEAVTDHAYEDANHLVWDKFKEKYVHVDQHPYYEENAARPLGVIECVEVISGEGERSYLAKFMVKLLPENIRVGDLVGTTPGGKCDFSVSEMIERTDERVVFIGRVFSRSFVLVAGMTLYHACGGGVFPHKGNPLPNPNFKELI